MSEGPLVRERVEKPAVLADAKPSFRNDFNNEHFNLETLHFVVDSGLGILNCSESVLRVFSTEMDAILGSNFRDFLVQFHSDWGTKLPKYVADVLRGGYHLPWGNFTQENVGWNVSSVAVNPDARDGYAIVFVPGPAPEMLSHVSEEGITHSMASLCKSCFIVFNNLMRAFMHLCDCCQEWPSYKMQI